MRIAVCLVLIATSALADDVSDAIKLLKNKDPHQNIAGAQRIRGMGPRAKKASKQLVKLTGHENWQVRREAGTALKSIGAASARYVLKTLKSSKNVAQRLLLAELVFIFGRDIKERSEAIVKLLDDDNAEVRHALAMALAKMPPDCLPPLMEALADKSPDVRGAASLSLGKLGTAALGSLTEALKSKNPVVRAGAVAAIGKIGPTARSAGRAVDELRTDPEPIVRAAAAEAIGNLRGNEAHFIPALISMFEDPDSDVRWAAARGVARFGPAAAPLLVGAFRGKGASFAAFALRRIGPKAEPTLQEACGSDNAATRAAAASVLVDVTTDPKDAAAVIRPLLEDADASVRSAAADALATRGARFAQAELLEVVVDKDPSVRASAVRALGQLSLSGEVRDAIEKARGDKDISVQLAAESARWSSGEDSKLLAKARAGLASPDARTRDAACRSLYPMGRGAAEALPDLLLALEEHPTPDVVQAVGSIAASHGNGLLGRAERFTRAPKPTKEAIENALTWLVQCQDTKKSGINEADGRWHPKEFVNHYPAGSMNGPGRPLYSGGVTGLIVSLHLAIGRADDPAVREGLDFLVRYQNSLGYLSDMRSQHFMISHAFATMAMCEAWIVTGEPRYRQCAVRAVRACEAARNPDMAWRYEPRGGQNDTNVTSAVLFALALAERGGIAVDPAAFEGGARWILSMTDEEFGQIGYNVKGGAPARPEGLQDAFPPEHSQSMTAAGLWSLALVARYAESPPVTLKKAYGLCMEVTPIWSGGRRDFYYWYWGTLVTHGVSGSGGSKWDKALTKALIDNQRADGSVFGGSWDPVGPWGADGGRLYSTAICALMLATPYRLSEDFVDGKPTGEYAKAAKALAKAAGSPDPAIADGAALWLRRIRE